MEPCAVVLDVGKTNLKLCAVDRAGVALRTLTTPNVVRAGPPYPHFDVDGIFAWAVAGLRSLARDYAIEAIVPVAHGAAAALLAGDSLALPVLDYEFEGVGAFDADYEPAARDFSRTFSPRLAAGLNLGRQLFWLERAFPAEFARVTQLLPYPQYWAFRLSGAKVSEWTSLGCHTDLWEPERGSFSRLARARGWDALLPERASAWTRIGAFDGIAVVAGIHDSNASYLAHRAFREDPFAVVSTGTWVVCMARGGDLARLRPDLDTLANVDAFGAPVPCSRFMGGRWFATASDRRAATRRCVRETDRCLSLLGARGDLVIEGSFAANRDYCAGLAALRPTQPTFVSGDATGTLRGGALLAFWPPDPALAPRLEPCPPADGVLPPAP